MSLFNNWLAQVLEIERLALASYYELGLAWCSHLGLGRPRAGVTGKGRSQRTAAITRQNPMGLSPDLRTGSTTKGRGLAASCSLAWAGSVGFPEPLIPQLLNRVITAWTLQARQPGFKCCLYYLLAV